MKTLFRTFSLTAILALVGLGAASSQTTHTCRYLCINSSGKTINWAAQTTENECCESPFNLSCPAGYSWDTTITWNGGVCP